MRVWDRKIEDRKMGMGRVGEPHVSNRIAILFLSTIFLSHTAVGGIQYPWFSRLQNGGNPSFGSHPDKHEIIH